MGRWPLFCRNAEFCDHTVHDRYTGLAAIVEDPALQTERAMCLMAVGRGIPRRSALRQLPGECGGITAPELAEECENAE